MATRASKTEDPQTRWEGVGAEHRLFSDEGDLRGDVAWAGLVYSMVPYLGILFVPFALGASIFGFVRPRHRPSHERYRFVFLAGLSVVILAIQIFLWWLLYFIPKMGI